MEMVGVDQILNASGVAAIPVAGTAVVYTRSFKLDYGSKFGYQYQCSSTGADAIDVKIELEEGNVLPTTEGVADGNFVVPDGGLTVVASATAKLVHIGSLSPVVAKYGRFKITGAAGNSNTTTVNIKLAKVEDHG